MSQPVIIGLVDAEPLVLRSSIWTMRCKIPVLPGGDGATWATLEERTERCDHKTTIIVGQAPTCFHHLVDAIDMLDVINREAGVNFEGTPIDPRPFPPRLHGLPEAWPIIDCRPVHAAPA